MLRFLGFLLGVVLAVVVLAAILVAPVREHAVTLATELTGAIFDSANEHKIKQGNGVSEVNAVPALAQGKKNLSEPATIKEVEAATPGLVRDGAPPDAALITAAKSTASVQPATQETEVLPTQPASAAEKMTAAAPGVQQEAVSTDPGVIDDVNDTSGEPVAWQPVWRAFRSELSAQGFADHLQRLTGQEYRVRRASPWSYQVELAYVDEWARDNLLHEIQTKTGLGLVEMQP